MTATLTGARRARGALPAVTHRRQSDPAWNVGVVLVANAVVVVGLWIRHGGLDTLRTPGGPLTAAGQVMGLLGAYAVLVELLLMSRIGWIERAIGFDRLAVWHRWGGFASVTLLVGHAIFITMGYAAISGQSFQLSSGISSRTTPMC